MQGLSSLDPDDHLIGATLSHHNDGDNLTKPLPALHLLHPEFLPLILVDFQLDFASLTPPLPAPSVLSGFCVLKCL